jgi:hypothetical protein
LAGSIIATQLSLIKLRDRIGQWLKSGIIQATEGGGVAGRLDAKGKPIFLYGEITGYWLRWASLYDPNPGRMTAAIAFLMREWSKEAPAATRAGSPGDWRNGAVFSFDLAMIMQGLADAAPIVGEQLCTDVAKHLEPWLERMVDADGILIPYLALETDGLPARWSTRPGPFQAKTAAAMLAVPEHWVSPRVSEASRRTMGRWIGAAAQHSELHARFYAIEGSIRGGGELSPKLVLEGLGAEGWLPEEIGTPKSFARGDVQAQALRLLCLSPLIDEATLETVTASLIRHVRDDGSVGFRIGESAANVWCAMFAHQALDWLCHIHGNDSVHPPLTNAII